MKRGAGNRVTAGLLVLIVAGLGVTCWVCRRGSDEQMGGIASGLHGREDSLVAAAKWLEDLFSADTLWLDTPPEGPLGTIRAIRSGPGGLLLVTVELGAGRGVYLFDGEGRFLSKIGATGKGPGEYLEPGLAVFDNRGRAIVYDGQLRRLSIFERDGRFVRSFYVDVPTVFPLVGVLLGPGGTVALHSQGRFLTWRKTTWVYSLEGKCLRAFGRVSEEWQRVRRSTGSSYSAPEPYLVFLGGKFYETDAVSYRIRVYDRRGREMREFGVAPAYWRCLADADLSKFPTERVLTPSVMRKIEAFHREEFGSCSQVFSLQAMGKRYLLECIVYGERSPSPSKFGFMVYAEDGRLIARDLTFRNPPVPGVSCYSYFIMEPYDRIFVVRYWDQEPDRVQLIRFVWNVGDGGSWRRGSQDPES